MILRNAVQMGQNCCGVPDAVLIRDGVAGFEDLALRIAEVARQDCRCPRGNAQHFRGVDQRSRLHK